MTRGRWRLGARPRVDRRLPAATGRARCDPSRRPVRDARRADTYAVASDVHDLLVKTHKSDHGKITEIKDLVWEHLEIDRVLEVAAAARVSRGASSGRRRNRRRPMWCPEVGDPGYGRSSMVPSIGSRPLESNPGSPTSGMLRGTPGSGLVRIRVLQPEDRLHGRSPLEDDRDVAALRRLLVDVRRVGDQTADRDQAAVGRSGAREIDREAAAQPLTSS